MSGRGPTLANPAAASVLALVTLLGACSRPADDDESTAAQNGSSTPQSPGVVKLDPGMQQQLNLKAEALRPVTMQPEITAYGRVLDPTPLAVLVAELTSAQAALTASEKEYARVQMLLGQSNASERELQAAGVQAARDRSAVQSARDRIALAWGVAVLRTANLSTFTRDLTTQKSELVRIDVPMSEPMTDAPQTARLARAADAIRFVNGEFLGFAPATDPQVQGQGLLYLVADNSLQLTPETTVVAFLSSRGTPLQGVLIPSSAVVRHDAEPCVYVPVDRTTFERIALPAMQATEGGWLVTAGLQAGDRVVTDGAQILLSEEFKSQVRLQE